MSTLENRTAVLSSAELEELWHQAWLIVRQRCQGTLTRLTRGWGGAYDAQDFYQDAFLAFRSLAESWASRDPREPEGELWSAWRRLLWHGGARILRRPPQRLGRVQAQSEPDLDALMDDIGDCRDDALARALLEHLVDRDDPERLLVQAERHEEHAATVAWLLAGLRPDQRLLLTWIYLDGRRPREVAPLLDTTPAVISSRVYQALRILRRRAARRQHCAAPDAS